MWSKMVEVQCLERSRVRLGGYTGTVKRLLREGEPTAPKVVALVYWDGGRMSFEREKSLEFCGWARS